ncbi:MAG: BT_3928 family protein [Rikenellaceae bacterium]
MHEISHNAQQSRALKITAHIARTFMGVVFIASGFVKAIDPWGTIIKVEEYMQIYGVEWLRPLSVVLSIWLCGAEMMMGCMLTFKVRIRFVSICAFVSMCFFTVLSFLSATIFPVEDCGCFGDALKLSPWQTFAKNLILLPAAFVILWRYRRDKVFAFNRLELLLATVFFLITMGLGTYCYRHLPIIDLLPYRVGVNLPQAIDRSDEVMTNDIETLLVYRNLRSGKLREFSLDDKAWHDDTKWEWVETRVEEGADEDVMRPLVSEFMLRNAKGRICTDKVLATKGVLNMIFVTSSNEEDMSWCRANIERYIEAAQQRGESVVCVTPEMIDKSGKLWGVECFNIDVLTMKTVLRAKYGVMVLRDGVIERKLNCRDM